jgi:Uri superfamily endonuclease
MGAQQGTYALLLRARVEQAIEVGALGTLSVRPGTYVYVGSAFGPGGLSARVRRHADGTGTLHWHVDYLRAVTTLVVSQAEGVGCRIEHYDRKEVSNGSSVTPRSALYSTWKT